MTDRADIPSEEVIAAGIAGALLDLHTALPGIVQTYDAATGTCSVLPAVKRALSSEDDSIALESLPVIPNVRVCWPGAAGFELHLPLSAGDTVLLVFNEADSGKFEDTGEESAPAWLERHGLHSPVAYPYNRQPQATLGGARMVCPSPFSFGGPVASLVALADKVDEALTIIKTQFNLHTHVSATPGSPTAAPLPLIAALPATACTKLKAE